MINKKSIIYVIIALILLVLPFLVTSRYLMHIFITCLIYVIIAQGLNLLVGYTKYTSFGHNAFYGVGAYASAIFMKTMGLSFWLALPLSVIITAIVAFGAGYFPLRMRLKGSYFALVTMALGLVIVSVIHNEEQITGGPAGFPGIPSAGDFFGIALDSRRAYYYLVLAFAVFVILLVRRIINSKLGRSIKSIGQDEDTAESIGINVGYYKILCFVISAAITGLAGSLFAHYSRFLGPDMFGSAEAVDMLTMVMIGGMGTIVGPIIGAVTLVILPEAMRFLAEYRQIFFSIFLILTILFMPRGLYGLKDTFKIWQKSHKGPEVKNRGMKS